MSDLERQLAAYTEFLEERSLAQSADHIKTNSAVNAADADEPDAGDVIVVDLMERNSKAETGSEGGNAGFRRRIPLLIAAAAAVVLIVAVGLFRGDDEGTSDVIDQPDVDTELPVTPDPEIEPTPGDSAVDPVVAAEPDLGEILTTAIRNGDSATLEAMYSPEVSAVLEGTEIGPEIAYPLFTDVSMRDLIFADTSECSPMVTTGSVSCRFHLDMDFLDDVTETQSGSVEFELVDGVIVLKVQDMDDFAGALDLLAPYRTWIEEVDPDSAAAMFVPAGMVAYSEESAALHAELSSEYNAGLAVLDGNPDFGELVAGSGRAGDAATLEAIYSPDLVAVFEGAELGADVALPILTSVAMRDLITQTTTECSAMRTDGFVRCRFHLDFDLLDDVTEPQSGSVVFTVEDGLITAYEQVADDFPATLAALAPYRDFVQANSLDSFATMFNPAGMINYADESAALHAELSAEYNASLG